MDFLRRPKKRASLTVPRARQVHFFFFIEKESGLPRALAPSILCCSARAASSDNCTGAGKRE
jgi:hypothetical protein